MNLEKTIEKDFVTAYKARLQDKVAVLRMLKTAFKNKKIELQRELTDTEVLEIILKEKKQRQDSREQFQNAGRTDLAEKEACELQILNDYLPQPISQEELASIVDETIASLDAKRPAQMGKVISAIMAQYKGRAEGRDVSALVKARL